MDVVGDLDVDDCATGSFCSSCAIPPRAVGGLWSDGAGCDACCLRSARDAWHAHGPSSEETAHTTHAMHHAPQAGSAGKERNGVVCMVICTVIV